MAAATFTSAIAAAAVPLENNNNNIISSSPFFPRKQNKEEEGIPPHSSSSSRLSKPSWVVRTEEDFQKPLFNNPKFLMRALPSVCIFETVNGL
ncbi:hypothetical protein AMTR_s00149p00042100 [Amborella trichopoda]|uniref:Uncharacterized protein n=1 Tax=Amborella trichopoda TaxID=13333 RepID=W1PNG9_AMBTC|nr:hypothetical protein AMTR_s00149p00042100 [Amborella trichopoda]